MGNLGGMEVLVILLVALIVLGPAKLPDAAKQVGKAVNELRRISGGFQREMREALQDPLAEDKARERGRSITADQRAARASGNNPHAKADATEPTGSADDATEPTGSADDATESADSADDESA